MRFADHFEVGDKFIRAVLIGILDSNRQSILCSSKYEMSGHRRTNKRMVVVDAAVKCGVVESKLSSVIPKYDIDTIDQAVESVVLFLTVEERLWDRKFEFCCCIDDYDPRSLQCRT